jgi:hypothetical protein
MSEELVDDEAILPTELLQFVRRQMTDVVRIGRAFRDVRKAPEEEPQPIAPVPRIRLHPDERAAAPEHPKALVQVVLEVEEVLQVRVADDGVERLVVERQPHRVQVHVVRGETAARRALGAEARDVGAGDVGAAVLQELREEAGAAPRLEHPVPWLDARDDHAQPVEVDLALGQLAPVMVVVVLQVHGFQPPAKMRA